MHTHGGFFMRQDQLRRRIGKFNKVRIAVVIIVATFILHYVATGRLISMVSISFLANRVHVEGVRGNALVLQNGDVCVLPHVAYVPTNCVVMAALKKGVAIDESGEILALLKIDHWCGNDPVVYHIEKVNLSALALATDFGCASNDLKQRDWYVDMCREIPCKQALSHLRSNGWSISNLPHVRYIARKLAGQNKLVRDKIGEGGGEILDIEGDNSEPK